MFPHGQYTFECEYNEKRTVTFPKNSPLAYNVFYWDIAKEFGLNGVTILHGQDYIQSQEDLDALLSDSKSTYELAIYDAYDSYSTNDQPYEEYSTEQAADSQEGYSYSVTT